MQFKCKANDILISLNDGASNSLTNRNKQNKHIFKHKPYTSTPVFLLVNYLHSNTQNQSTWQQQQQPPPNNTTATINHYFCYYYCNFVRANEPKLRDSTISPTIATHNKQKPKHLQLQSAIRWETFDINGMRDPIPLVCPVKCPCRNLKYWDIGSVPWRSVWPQVPVDGHRIHPTLIITNYFFPKLSLSVFFIIRIGI